MPDEKTFQKIIKPITQPLIVNGRLIYNEANRASSIIRLKKKIVKEFPDLKKNKNMLYQFEFWRSYEETINRIKQMEEKGQGIPFLIFFYND